MTKQPNLSPASNSSRTPHLPHPKAKPVPNDVKTKKSKASAHPPRQRNPLPPHNNRADQRANSSPRKSSKESPAKPATEAKTSINARPNSSRNAAPEAPNPKWSGSTFHSSPSAATLPRPPFSRTSPPQSQQRMNSAPNMPVPMGHHGVPLPPPPFMAVGVPNAPPGAYPFNGMYGMPMYGNMGPHHGHPGMPFPHFAPNNHPMAFNPMFMGPGAMPMAQPNPTET